MCTTSGVHSGGAAAAVEDPSGAFLLLPHPAHDERHWVAHQAVVGRKEEEATSSG